VAFLTAVVTQVKFGRGFNPSESMGNVERWLIECEIAMR
jgi:hypothetical protein